MSKRQHQPQEPSWAFTSPEMAVKLRLANPDGSPNVKALYNMVARGTAPPAVRAGGRRLLFPRDAFERWVEDHRIEPAPGR
jgi:Helix-turn-helix domain